MLNTTTFEELISNFETKQDFINYFNKNNIVFKERSIEKIKILIIDNQELNKVTKGIDYGKGKHKIYFIEEDIIMLYNYFGWQGNYENDSTSNFMTILKASNPEKYKELESLNEGDSIFKIEEKLKEICNIKTKKVVKYSNLDEFIEKNPKLIVKYIKSFLEGGILFNFDDELIDKINYFNNEEFCLNKDEKVVEIYKKWQSKSDIVWTCNSISFEKRKKDLVQKINKKLEKKEQIILSRSNKIIFSDLNKILESCNSIEKIDCFFVKLERTPIFLPLFATFNKLSDEEQKELIFLEKNLLLRN